MDPLDLGLALYGEVSHTSQCLWRFQSWDVCNPLLEWDEESIVKPDALHLFIEGWKEYRDFLESLPIAPYVFLRCHPDEEDVRLRRFYGVRVSELVSKLLLEQFVVEEPFQRFLSIDRPCTRCHPPRSVSTEVHPHVRNLLLVVLIRPRTHLEGKLALVDERLDLDLVVDLPVELDLLKSDLGKVVVVLRDWSLSGLSSGRCVGIVLPCTPVQTFVTLLVDMVVVFKRGGEGGCSCRNLNDPWLRLSIIH